MLTYLRISFANALKRLTSSNQNVRFLSKWCTANILKKCFSPLLFQSFRYTKSSLISVNGFDYYIPQKTVYMHEAFNYMSKYAVSFCTKSQGLVKELYKYFFDLMYNLLWFSFLTSYSCCINKNSIAQLLLGKYWCCFTHTSIRHPHWVYIVRRLGMYISLLL